MSQSPLRNKIPVALTWTPYILSGALILYFGRNIFIPIAFALLISFVLYPICAWLEKKGLGKGMSIAISVALLVISGLLVALLLVFQVIQFAGEWPLIQDKFGTSVRELSDALVNLWGITKDEQSKWLTKISDQSGASILSVARTAVLGSVSSFTLLILIPVYTALILYYRKYWLEILYRFVPENEKQTVLNILSHTIKTYYDFIKGMIVVYLVVGILNSIGLLLLGVPHAILFGFIASVLTFIPYLGIMVGALLPMAMAWITYDSIWYPLGIAGIFTFVQYLEANVIFPFAVGKRLNVNTLAILVAIFAGELLWGMAGMILFIPFLGIAKFMADQNPKWKTVSLILGSA